MHRSIALLALACIACGEPAPTPAQASEAPQPTDDAKRQFVLEVAGKVDAIREAAAARDLDRLGALMCDDFDFGGPARGREAALASWRADNTRLDALVRTLEGDCALEETNGSQGAPATVRWVCRPRANDAARGLASLSHDERGWQWCVFELD